jgi:hypothetical protein
VKPLGIEAMLAAIANKGKDVDEREEFFPPSAVASEDVEAVAFGAVYAIHSPGEAVIP